MGEQFNRYLDLHTSFPFNNAPFYSYLLNRQRTPHSPGGSRPWRRRRVSMAGLFTFDKPQRLRRVFPNLIGYAIVHTLHLGSRRSIAHNVR